jgi:hypothetical protein
MRKLKSVFWLVALFSAGNAFALHLKTDAEKCARLLSEPIPAEIHTLSLRFANHGMALATTGKLALEDRRLPVFESALRRRQPKRAAAIIEAMRNARPLEKEEYRILVDAVFREIREAAHTNLQKAKFPIHRNFREAAKIAYAFPGRLEEVWQKLGFRFVGDEFVSPTYFEAAKNLSAVAEEFGVPEELRIKLTAVFQEAFTSEKRYHAIDLPLSEGSDVQTGQRFLSTPEFLEAINSGLMPIEAEGHDLAHAVVWTLHPDVFREVKRLGELHIATPKDEALFFRLNWASEVFSLPDASRIQRAKALFLSQEAWGAVDSSVSVEARFALVEKALSRKTYSEIATYAEEILAPNFRSYFEPYGGGPGQYGEMQNVWTDGHRQIERFYEDRTPITSWKHSQWGSFQYSGRDLSEGQLENLGAEIFVVIHGLRLSPAEKERRLRDLVARMELVLGELSRLSPAATLKMFGESRAARTNSRFAEVLRLVRGEHSTLYRVLVD